MENKISESFLGQSVDVHLTIRFVQNSLQLRPVNDKRMRVLCRCNLGKKRKERGKDVH
jgi:hypothetical protein